MALGMDPILNVDEHRNAAFSVARGRLDAPLPTPHPAPDPNGTWQQRRIHKSEPEILSPTSPITQLLSGPLAGRGSQEDIGLTDLKVGGFGLWGLEFGFVCCSCFRCALN